jgi:hypothetical protein
MLSEREAVTEDKMKSKGVGEEEEEEEEGEEKRVY